MRIWHHLRFTAAWLWLLIILSAPCGHAGQDMGEWQELSGDHFRIYYQDSTDFAGKTLDHAEDYYDNLTAKLGFDKAIHAEHLSFWLWENRCEIILYPHRQSYLENTGAPEWSGGRANSDTRTITSYSGSQDFLGLILPHEVAHLLFKEYVGARNYLVPSWLHEGVAVYAEEGERETSKEFMRRLTLIGRHFPFTKFHKMVPDNRMGSETAKKYYAQAATIIHFLLDEYGSSRFLILTNYLRDGYPFLRGLGAATYGRLNSLEAFEQEWLRYLDKGMPESVASTRRSKIAGVAQSLLDKSPRDKPMLLYFWSIYGVSCVQSLPELVKLHGKYGDRVEFIGIDLDSFGTKRVNKFLSKLRFEIPFPIGIDKRRTTAARYSVSVLPSLLILDGNGAEVFRHVGYKPGDELLWERALSRAARSFTDMQVKLNEGPPD